MKIWRERISYLLFKKNISNALFTIKNIKKVQTLYYSLIHSHLSYEIVVWDNPTQSRLPHTIVLQKRALHIIHKRKVMLIPFVNIFCVLKLHVVYGYQSIWFIFVLSKVNARPHSIRYSHLTMISPIHVALTNHTHYTLNKGNYNLYRYCLYMKYLKCGIHEE